MRRKARIYNLVTHWGIVRITTDNSSLIVILKEFTGRRSQSESASTLGSPDIPRQVPSSVILTDFKDVIEERIDYYNGSFVTTIIISVKHGTIVAWPHNHHHIAWHGHITMLVVAYYMKSVKRIRRSGAQYTDAWLPLKQGSRSLHVHVIIRSIWHSHHHTYQATDIKTTADPTPCSPRLVLTKMTHITADVVYILHRSAWRSSERRWLILNLEVVIRPSHPRSAMRTLHNYGRASSLNTRRY